MITIIAGAEQIVANLPTGGERASSFCSRVPCLMLEQRYSSCLSSQSAETCSGV